MAWWVTAVAYPAHPDTAVPFYLQAADRAAAEQKIGGPPLAGPFATKPDAQAWVRAHPGDFGKGKTNIAPPAAPNAAHVPGPKNPLTNPLTGLAAIGDFFQRLTQASTWVRVGEVLLGLALITVGLAHLASGTAAGRAALKAGKAAAIL